MKRRFGYVAFLLLSLYIGSYFLQSPIARPTEALSAAADYESVSIGFCVNNAVGERWAIKVNEGELPSGSLGLLTPKNVSLTVGDCVSALVQLSPIDGFSRFAFKASLKELQGSIRHQANLATFNAMRKFASSFQGDPENLVSGLAIGIDQGLSEQFIVNMKSTGLTHLTAVSGANCAIVLGAFWLIGKAFRVSRNFRFILSILALVGYVALVGPQPSVLRAAFMMTVVMAALEFGRKVWVPGALGLGSSVLLVVDPWLVAEYGFWLSVLATMGLVILTPPLNERLQKHLPKTLALGLSATVAAQIWCLPLLVDLQGGFTTYSVLANLLVEPAVPAITLLGLLATFFGPVIPWLGQGLMIVAALPAKWIVLVANSLAQGPQQLLDLPQGLFGFALLSAFVVGLSVALVKKKYSAGLFSGLLILVWLGTSIGELAPKLAWPIANWELVSCDVGQGDATVLRSGGEVAVIDVGKDPVLIDNCLDRLGVRRIDLLVVTHFDFDHVGGLAGAKRGRTIDLALVSMYPDERPEARFMTDDLNDVASQVIAADAGLAGNLGQYNWSVISSLGEQANSANQGSLGIRFESSNFVIYTLADLDTEAQTRALGSAIPSTKFTIVKVSHHGSADQFQEFYERIEPDLALISAGKGNSYGHPTKRILEILESIECKIFRTDQQGAVSLANNNGAIEVFVAGAR